MGFFKKILHGGVKHAAGWMFNPASQAAIDYGKNPILVGLAKSAASPVGYDLKGENAQLTAAKYVKFVPMVGGVASAALSISGTLKARRDAKEKAEKLAKEAMSKTYLPGTPGSPDFGKVTDPRLAKVYQSPTTATTTTTAQPAAQPKNLAEAKEIIALLESDVLKKADKLETWRQTGASLRSDVASLNRGLQSARASSDSLFTAATNRNKATLASASEDVAAAEKKTKTTIVVVVAIAALAFWWSTKRK